MVLAPYFIALVDKIGGFAGAVISQRILGISHQ